MFINSTNVFNGLLPDDIKSSIPSDDQKNWLEIEKCLKEIVDQKVFVDSKTLGKCVRLIHTRINLKYYFDINKREHALRILIDTLQKNVAAPMKIKVLGVMSQMCKGNRVGSMTINLQWEYFWNEAIALATRTRKTKSIASEQLTISIVKNLITFLHDARRLVSDEEANKIVTLAMAKMEDLVRLNHVEGVILLTTCLPTDYNGYDEILPRWLAMWQSVEHNHDWDCQWATLFARAKKYTKIFNWLSIKPFILEKIRELIALPALNGRIPQQTEFPHAFPSYYNSLLTQQVDATKMALYKLTKLLYFLSVQGPLVQADPIAVSPPTVSTNLDLLRDLKIPGLTSSASVHVGAQDICNFLQSIRIYFYPSNNGAWTSQLPYFVSTLIAEMSRHVGKALAYKTFGETKLSMTSSKVSANANYLLNQPVHSPTLRYIGGCLITFILEALYGKNPMLIQISSSSLKNLCVIDPTFGTFILPILISALDPAAANQSHQAPSALNAISSIFKHLLYPNPIILTYLPTILKLSLEGIDPSDSRKSAITLNMFSTILMWFPIRGHTSESLPTVATHPTYLSLVAQADSLDKSISSTLTATEYQSLVHQCHEAIIDSDWAVLFIDKLFALLEAREAPQKGQHGGSHNIGSFVSECMHTYFRALDPSLSFTIANKVINYLKSTTAMNAAKDIAYMVDVMVSHTPALLPLVLDAFVTPDMSSISTEKLGFRLRVIGGAVRSCGGEILLPQIELLKPLIGKAYTHHSEKIVRKNACKLLRDILRSLSSFYITNEQWNVVLPYGSPNNLNDVQINWYSPTVPAIQATVTILREFYDSVVHDVASTFESILGEQTAGAESSALAPKRLEETIVNDLQLILKCVRGAAEVLGDSTGEGKVFGAEDSHTRGTRCAVPHGVSAEDRHYLETFRESLSHFLSNVHDHLHSTETAVGGVYSSLSDSPKVRTAWMKILQALVIRRMARHRNSDLWKKYYVFSKRAARSLITQYMRRVSKRVVSDTSLPTTWPAVMTTTGYWCGHDLSLHTVADRLRILISTRRKELSFYTMRGHNVSPIYLTNLSKLSQICGHEYDIIRTKALKYFGEISSRFGWRMTDIIKPMIVTIHTPGTSYAVAAGALSVIGSSRIIRRVAGQWDLTLPFLEAILLSPAMINAIPEPDKRVRVMNSFSEMFVHYLTKWHQLAVSNDADHKAISFLRNQLLTQTNSTSGSNVIGADGTSKEVVTQSVGLRHELFTAHSILQLIGNDYLDTPILVWSWAIHILSSSNGSPTQLIALSAVIKLSHMAVHLPSPESLMMKEELANHFTGDKFWNALFLSISQAHPKKSENAQWSLGIEEILRAAEYMRGVLPRTICSKVSVRTLFSTTFRRDFAGLWLTLPFQTREGLSVELVQSLIAASREILSTNEEEARINNCTRAELFAGLCHVTASQGSSGDLSVWSALTAFFLENIQKVSLDYCQDWAEALCFGLSATPINIQSILATSILENIQSILRVQSQDADIKDEGFTTQAKFLMFARGILYADVAASAEAGYVSVFGEKLVALFSDSNYELMLTYRTSRNELATILGGLHDTVAMTTTQATNIISKLLSKLDGFVENNRTDTAVIMTDDTESTTELTVTDPVAVTSKHIAEIAARWLDTIVHSVLQYKAEAIIPLLFTIILKACGHVEIEVAKSAHENCLLVAQSVSTKCRDLTEPTEDLLMAILAVLEKFASHSSWHVRETVIMCTTALYSIHWVAMTVVEKKRCRDILNEGLNDSRPEVQFLAKIGMVSYLIAKPQSELQSLADAYIKNSEVLVARDRKKRKVQKDNGVVGTSTTSVSDKPDRIHNTTVLMMGSLILAFPYDLPTFMPALLTSFVKHIQIPALKDVVAKTIQDFKRTHQDRWEDFKQTFTHDQLADLQGAGAAHYFS